MKKNINQEEKFEKLQQSKWARISDLTFGIIVLNLNILLYSLLGLVVLGIGPSIYAGYALLDESEGLYFGSDVFKQFFKYYKANFIRGNILFYSIVGIYLILIRNLTFYASLSGTKGLIGLYIIATLLIIFSTSVISYYPIDIIYHQKTFKDRIRIAFYLIFVKPLIILKIIGMLAGFIFVMILFPQFFIFFGIGTPIYIIYKPISKFTYELLEANLNSEEKE